MSASTLFPIADVAYALPASTAARLDTFLHGRPATTTAAYRREIVDMMVAIGRPLVDVDLEDLQHYADVLCDRYVDAEGRPTSTVRHRLYVARSFFAFATSAGWIARDPSRLLRIPAVRDRKDERILEERDAIRMIALSEGRDRVLVRTLYVAGLRVSEACRLRVRDVVSDDRGRGILLVWLKGSKLNRVPVPASLYGDLIRHAGGRGRDAYVFAGRAAGSALTRDAALRIVKRAAARAGIARRLSPHWLRHAHGTHAERNGAKVSAIQKTLGHADARTTMGYLHPDPDDSSAFFVRG